MYRLLEAKHGGARHRRNPRIQPHFLQVYHLSTCGVFGPVALSSGPIVSLWLGPAKREPEPVWISVAPRSAFCVVDLQLPVVLTRTTAVVAKEEAEGARADGAAARADSAASMRPIMNAGVHRSPAGDALLAETRAGATRCRIALIASYFPRIKSRLDAKQLCA